MNGTTEHLIQADIFECLREQILSLLPELSSRTLTPEDSLHALGANSMDRAEIIINTMAALQLNLPLVRFGNAKNLQGIVDILHEGTLSLCPAQ